MQNINEMTLEEGFAELDNMIRTFRLKRHLQFMKTGQKF